MPGEESLKTPKNMTAPSTQIAPLARNFGEETQGERLARKAKDAPFMPIGILGCLAAVGYGIYSYKHRGGMSTSVFLMQLRVTAQGAVVVCLTAGIGWNLIQDFVLPKFRKQE